MTTEELTIQATWGPRAETVTSCVQRWSTALTALAEVDPVLSAWYISEGDGTDPADEVSLADTDLAEIVDAGDRGGELGFGFAAYNGHDAAYPVFVRHTVGLTAPVVGLVNTVWVEAYPDTAQEVRRWAGLAEPALAALVAAWEPDSGQAWTPAVKQAQHPAPRRPWAGIATYLSAGRRQAVPADLAATGRPTPDGGLLLPLAGPDGGLPHPELILDLGARLLESGAFEPTPLDRARS